MFTSYVLYVDVELGFRYLSFLVINLMAMFFVRADFKAPAFIFLSTIFLSYFLRGFIISQDYNEFTMSATYPVNREVVLAVFDQALWVSGVFGCGFFLASLKWTSFKKSYVAAERAPALIRMFWLIVTILALLLLLKLFLYYGLDLGRKGFENASPFAFLLQFIPLDLPFVVCGLYFFKYKDKLTLTQLYVLGSVLLAFSFSVLISGSKSFIMIIAVCYVVYLLYTKAKIKLMHFFSLFMVGTLLTVASFALSRAVKFTFFVPNLTATHVVEMSMKILKEEPKIELLKEVTARFNGFDGQLKLHGVQNQNFPAQIEDLNNSFELDEVLLRVLEGLVPRLELTSSINCGVAVGRYLEKIPLNRVYAGAVGIVGASQLSGGHYYLFFVLTLGLISGFFFKLIGYIRDPDLKFIFFFFGCFFIMNLAMSGNFDALLIQLLIKIGVTVVFALISLLFYNSRRAVILHGI